MNIKLWCKIIKAYYKYNKMCKKQGYTIQDLSYELDPFACHLHMEMVIKERLPAGIVDLSYNWEEKGR